MYLKNQENWHKKGLEEPGGIKEKKGGKKTSKN
jgi:hypothetical protein